MLPPPAMSTNVRAKLLLRLRVTPCRREAGSPAARTCDLKGGGGESAGGGSSLAESYGPDKPCGRAHAGEKKNRAGEHVAPGSIE